MNNYNYNYYPKLDDKNFHKKIYLKKEFNKNKIPINKQSFEDICNSKEFKLLPQQKFIKNFISVNTPYNGVLIFHGTGVGKTCSAISIAEGFKSLVTGPDKRILVIVSKNIQDNFKREIFDPQKDIKKKRDEYTQCTGLNYELLKQDEFMSKDEKYKKIKTLINSNYEFHAYGEFVNDVKRTSNWPKRGDELSDRTKKYIKYRFSNRVIIIDEIHNIKKSDNGQTRVLPILKKIIEHSTNIKLVLMSATPMFNSPKEIIDLLNLLLLNDKRELIRHNDIFDKDGNLKDKGEEILMNKSKGYISYLRGEKPPMFPFRIYPERFFIPKPKFNILGNPIKNNIKYLKLFPCELSNEQFKYYNKTLQTFIQNKKNDKNDKNNKNNKNNKNDIFDNNDQKEFENLSIHLQKNLIQVTNIIYPNKNGSFTYGKHGYSKVNDGNGAFIEVSKMDPYTRKNVLKYKYQDHVLFNRNTKDEKPFLHIDHLKKYSSKIYNIIENVNNSKGIIFIYSDYVDSGVIPIALTLEQYGFQRYTDDNETSLLDYNENNQRGGGKIQSRCYLCGKNASHRVHIASTSNYNHKFYQAKYILLSGKYELSKMEPGKLTRIINSNNNKNGEIVKVLLATSRAKEGLDLKKIRQINILDPWYNLSRIEQIIGRGIRHKSHCGLPASDRNVEVFLMCSKRENINYELVDQSHYRLSENKDIIIKKIERILKTNAIDCALNKNGNTINEKTKVKQITSKGREIIISINDVPKTKQCDYLDKCEYKCVWEPDKEYPLDLDTYNENFAKDEIEIIKNYIKFLYKKNNVYNLKDIIKYVLKNDNTIDKINILKALEMFMNDVNSIVYDKYDREGKLILRNNYYIYQPLEIHDETIPLFYRDKPLTKKIENISIIDKITDENNNNNNSNLKTNKYNLIDEFDKFKQKNYKYNDLILMKYILDRHPDILTLLKTELIKYIEKQTSKYTLLILNSRKHNLLLYDVNIFNMNNLNKKTNKFYGIKYNKQYIYFNKSWIVINKEIIQKYEKNIKSKEYNNIYGFVEKYNFKILDNSKFKKAFTSNYKESKRSIITGRKCNTFKMNELIQILNKINDKLHEKSKKNMCTIIELELRKLNLHSNKIYIKENN